MAGPQHPYAAAVRLERDVAERGEHPVVLALGDEHLLEQPGQLRAGVPARTSDRQATRRQTPVAASAGPCPATSPITACTVPSAVSTTS